MRTLKVRKTVTCAYTQGNLHLVKRLLKEDDIDKVDELGMTPLFHAARWGHLQVLHR